MGEWDLVAKIKHLCKNGSDFHGEGLMEIHTKNVFCFDFNQIFFIKNCFEFVKPKNDRRRFCHTNDSKFSTIFEFLNFLISI
jgi:hypothetical protein